MVFGLPLEQGMKTDDLSIKISFFVLHSGNLQRRRKFKVCYTCNKMAGVKIVNEHRRQQTG